MFSKTISLWDIRWRYVCTKLAFHSKLFFIFWFFFLPYNGLLWSKEHTKNVCEPVDTFIRWRTDGALSPKRFAHSRAGVIDDAEKCRCWKEFRIRTTLILCQGFELHGCLVSTRGSARLTAFGLMPEWTILGVRQVPTDKAYIKF